jgi:hypothetical protein
MFLLCVYHVFWGMNMHVHSPAREQEGGRNSYCWDRLEPPTRLWLCVGQTPIADKAIAGSTAFCCLCIAYVTLPMSTGTTIDSLFGLKLHGCPANDERRAAGRSTGSQRGCPTFVDGVLTEFSWPFVPTSPGYRNWAVLKPIGYIRYEISWVRRIQFLGRFSCNDTERGDFMTAIHMCRYWMILTYTYIYHASEDMWGLWFFIHAPRIAKT